jgi:hypothetical protein
MEQNMDLEDRVTKLGTQVMGLDDRVAKVGTHVEELNIRMFAVEKDLAVIKSNYATTADVVEAKNSVIMWVVSAILLAPVLPLLVKHLGG